MSTTQKSLVELNFPGFSSDSANFWQAISDFSYVLSNQLDYLNFIISIFGIICNIFHLIVLTRKSMRQLSINIFMIGIAICDLGRMASLIIVLAPQYYKKYQIQNIPWYCITPTFYPTMVSTNISNAVSKFSQELSVWLGVTMAILRALVIKYPLKPRINCLINAKYGIRIMLLVTIFILPFWYFHYWQLTVQEYKLWISPLNCSNNPPNYSQMSYTFMVTDAVGGTFQKIILLSEGILFKLAPSILLPIATIVLVYELKKSKKVKMSNSNDKSTRLVTFFTLSFFIATAPLGILYVMEFFVYDIVGLVNLISNVSNVFQVLTIINGTVHFLICFFMSSQYRNTVRRMFGMKEVMSSLPRKEVTQTKSVVSSVLKKSFSNKVG
ncbi:hypothetical protein CAEBREN_07068 [Caenorhabditis brenneri]|uniref:G-protein coupled receptors family 1 profile domain-containing protein n=1 Tax=Caenorhabditis brenneri TaxID=135651 RepID=G0P663_CAEBE|nr:hypothetical protein CAEBREN_07068 [Caenorhabditis brenneri]